MFNFSVFVWKYPCLRKLFQKIKLACWSWNLKPRIILCKVWWWFSFLSYLARKYPFWVNLVQKFKIVSLSWKLVTRLFRICKIRWWSSLVLFYTLFSSFVEEIHLAFWCYQINLPAVYSERCETNGFSRFN